MKMTPFNHEMHDILRERYTVALFQLAECDTLEMFLKYKATAKTCEKLFRDLVCRKELEVEDVYQVNEVEIDGHVSWDKTRIEESINQAIEEAKKKTKPL